MTEFKDIAEQETLRLTPEMLAATQQAAPQKKKTPPPFSIRFTFEERARLEQAAAGMPLGVYIRQKLFDGDLTPRRTRGRNPVKDHAELACVLGALGASRLSSNLNQIAKAAHMGALPVTPELEEELSEACQSIRTMRADLMKALGFSDAEGPSMILKGSQRGGAMQLARHLLNAEENEHVEVYELRGFASNSSLSNALQEIVAISKGTRCQQMLFSLSLNPPIGESVPISDFEAAIGQVEQRLGLQDQARAIVFHEKEGRRHVHVVWSRIDVEEMKAINLPYFKMKLNDISKDLFLEHGWTLPEGFRDKSARDPMTFSREEWQQAKRAKQDPKELKAMFQECWTRSDNRASFQKALEERGFYLAKGDRRGFVALDYKGEVYALSRWSGQKTKDLKSKLGDPASLPTVEDTKALIAERMTGLIKRYIGDAETALKTKEDAIALKKAQIKERHCAARESLITRQAERWAEETKTRASRFRKGFAGIWDWLTGKSRQISKENEEEAFEAIKRDDQEREKQRQEQLEERRTLQEEFKSLKDKHVAEVAALRADIATYLDLGDDQDRPQEDHQELDMISEQNQNTADQDHQRDSDFEI